MVIAVGYVGGSSFLLQQPCLRDNQRALPQTQRGCPYMCLGAGGFEHISLLLKRVGWNVFTHGTHKLLLLEPPGKKENLPPVFEWKNIKIFSSKLRLTAESHIAICAVDHKCSLT